MLLILPGVSLASAKVVYVNSNGPDNARYLSHIIIERIKNPSIWSMYVFKNKHYQPY
jgi:hypothetical protein